VLWVNVVPAVTGKDCFVHLGVKFPQSDDIGIVAVGIVEEIVSVGQANPAV